MNCGFYWPEQHEELLARVWPEMGMACKRMFPDYPESAIRSKAWRMGLKAPKKAERDEPMALTRADKRNSRSCYGYIPGGPAPSVFHLAQKVQP